MADDIRRCPVKDRHGGYGQGLSGSRDPGLEDDVQILNSDPVSTSTIMGWLGFHKQISIWNGSG